MTQTERRRFLLSSLLAEAPEYRQLAVPDDAAGQKQLLRALLNVRPPRDASPEFLQVQDEYLRAELAQKGVTVLESLTPAARCGEAALYLWQGDITTLRCDAIVNAANSGMTGCYCPNHRCIDNAIHTFAGVQLRQACAELMRAQGREEPTGRAKLTPAFNLPCRFVLHTVGPIVTGRVTRQDRALLADRGLPAAGGESWAGKRGVLLHLHRGVPLSQRAGGRDRRAHHQRISGAGHQREKGDLQCFQKSGLRNLPASSRRRLSS